MKKYISVISGILFFVLMLSACKPISFRDFSELTSVQSGGNIIENPSYYYETTTLPSSVIQGSPTQPYYPLETVPSQPLETVPSQPASTEPSSSPAVTLPDYSAYSKQQIIDTYAEALNKTRNYKGNISVNHTEAFTADIKEANPGGALTELLASNIVKLVGSEGQQTLNFTDGKATNKDGEIVPLLLPQRTSFSLPAEGVASASISNENAKTHIRIVLVPETVSMGEVPKYNSTAVGYLDTSDMDFKIITISRVDIGYTGTVIDAYIRADGYVESVTYTINMSTYAELSGMGITGYGVLEGAQTEKWMLNW